MPLAHDVALRKAMNEWIESWRNYTLRNPHEQPALQFRERKYAEIIAMLNSRTGLNNDVDSITCPKCGKTSYNQHDILERYCGNCHQFHSSL